MNILELNLLLILIYAFIFLFIIRTRLSKLLFIIVTTLQLIIINGLRHMSVGVDTVRYFKRFMEIVNGEVELFTKESGYNIAQIIINIFSDNFNVWLTIAASFIFVPLAIFIYKNSSRVFVSYILYLGLDFYLFTFNGLRQSIAIIIVLLSYNYIINKKFLKFLLIILVATSFHTSAIIFVPMYFLAHIKWSKIYMFMLGFIVILFYIFRFQIGKLLTILYYDDATWALDRYEISGGIGGTAIMIFIIILLGIAIYNPNKYFDKENIVLSNIMIISFIIQMLSSFSYLFTRLNMFYLVFIILYIPYLFEKIGKGTIKLRPKEATAIESFGKLFLIILLVIHYYNNTLIDGFEILPYNFFWQL